MKRTNPKKGRDEDPGFVPISWDEALDIVADKLKAARAKGLHRRGRLSAARRELRRRRHADRLHGHVPRRSSPPGARSTMSFGSGQGVKCTHSEHLYGEFWHRAFTVCRRHATVRYIISFGANVEASGGVCGVKRHADARMRG